MDEREFRWADLEGWRDQRLGGGGESPEIRQGQQDRFASEQGKTRDHRREIAKMKRQKIIQRMRMIPPRIDIEREGEGDQIANREGSCGDALVFFRSLGEKDQQSNDHKANGQGDDMLTGKWMEGFNGHFRWGAVWATQARDARMR